MNVSKKRVVKEIIKRVGINGLIAIKAHIATDERNFYKVCQTNTFEYTVRNIIFAFLQSYKDFAQYQ